MPTTLATIVARAAALSAVALVACGGPGAPAATDDALGAYLDRHGLAAPSTPAGGPSAPPAPPVATRLAITVVSGRDLPDTDPGPGDTDPYVVLSLDGQRHRTTVIEGSLDPVWGDSFVLDVGPSPVLEVSLKDEDSLSSDETLGVVSQVLEPIAVGRTLELEIPFRGGAGGYVTLRLTGLPPRSGAP
jgi:hypothetical protein